MMIRPKKSRGKGSQRKKIANDSQETVYVSEESEPEAKPAKRKTASRRVVKEKVTLSVDDNINSNDLDTALEIVPKSVLEPTKRIKSGKVTSDSPKKLKGAPSLTLTEQEDANIMQALKEKKKTSKIQPGTGGSSEGTSTTPWVPDESTIGSKQESEHSKEDKLDDEEKDDKEGDADDEDDETKSDEDDIYKYKIRLHNDEDKEMINAEVDDFDKGDEEITDAAKENAKKTLERKDDPKKAELPPLSSSLSSSSGFGDQFLKLSSNYSLVSTIKNTIDSEINSLLEVKIQLLSSKMSYPNTI
nr:hypothetical protein [Tanacetum cinerariifolium]